MKTLIIDNYDSFTYNLAQLVAEVNGEFPVVVKNDQFDWPALAHHHYDVDNIIVSPGPGNPGRAEDFGVCRDAILESPLPILGVCLGHQGIGHLFGGRVTHAPEPMHGRFSAVHHDGRDLFDGVPQGFEVVRYHSLIVAEPMPTCIERTAWTSDGIVMGLRHRTRPLWGVQFHPESICSEYGRRLMENFAALTAARSPRRPVRGSSPPRAPRHSPAPAASYRLLHRKLDRAISPEASFVALYRDRDHAFWLDSSRTEDGLARFSFIGDASGPLARVVEYDVTTRTTTVHEADRTTSIDGSVLDYLDRSLAELATRADELPFDFQCGFVGYLGYEMKAECGGSNAHRAAQPDACFVLADRVIAFDHQDGATYLVALVRDDERDARAWLDRTERALHDLPVPPAVTAAGGELPVRLRLRQGRAAYLAAIRRCKALLRDGETYEVCLTNRITGACDVDPLALYRQLRAVNPAPYAAFFRLGATAIVCSSPERFLRVDRDRWAESKPIKGTAPRGKTPADDDALKHELRSEEKSRSENLMIVDLVRNDLGSVCEVGTVHVPRLMDVESFSTVHQLVSTIRGRLRPGITTLDGVRAAFPGGSMTGAPKRRTMQIIDELEGDARGIYSGSIGYLSCSGAADLNIVIRTAVLRDGRVTIGTGGAIVALSDPASELDEILLKARAIVRAIQLAACGRAEADPAIPDPEPIPRHPPRAADPAPADAGDQLEGFRRRLDEIDRTLVKLIADRLAICDEVAHHKRAHGIPMMQPHRVEQVKTRAAETGLGHGLSPGFVRALYGLIIDEACRRETSIIDGRDAAPVGSARDE